MKGVKEGTFVPGVPAVREENLAAGRAHWLADFTAILESSDLTPFTHGSRP